MQELFIANGYIYCYAGSVGQEGCKKIPALGRLIGGMKMNGNEKLHQEIGTLLILGKDISHEEAEKMPSPTIDAPKWQTRVESACVTLACGGAGTGTRTRMALMHPLDNIDPAFCQKMAADILFETIMAACEVHPALSATIERRIDELLSHRQGLRGRDAKSHYLLE